MWSMFPFLKVLASEAKTSVLIRPSDGAPIYLIRTESRFLADPRIFYQD